MKRILYLFSFFLILTQISRSQTDGLEYRRVHVYEELTGTWCGWCPRGMIGMEQMKEKYPDSFIGIAVHSSDVMSVENYESHIVQYLPTLPSGIMNRKVNRIGDPYVDIENLYQTESRESALTALDIKTSQPDEDSFTAVIRFKSKVTLKDISYRYAIVLVENNVTGTTSEYDQINYYSGMNVSMHGYENLPSLIPASQIAYQDVARTIYDDFYGIPTSFPQELAAEEMITFSVTYPFPSSIVNKEQVEVIALLLNEETGEILNAAKTAIQNIPTANSGETKKTLEAKILYSANQLSILFSETADSPVTIDVYTMEGVQVWRENRSIEHKITIPLPLVRSTYIVRLTLGKDVIIQKIAVY